MERAFPCGGCITGRHRGSQWETHMASYIQTNIDANAMRFETASIWASSRAFFRALRTGVLSLSLCHPISRPSTRRSAGSNQPGGPAKPRASARLTRERASLPIRGELQALVGRMAAQESTLGSKAHPGRIGNVRAGTVAKYMRARRSQGPTGTWREFLTRHAWDVWACDFFCVPTVLFQTFHVFFVDAAQQRSAICGRNAQESGRLLALASVKPGRGTDSQRRDLAVLAYDLQQFFSICRQGIFPFAVREMCHVDTVSAPGMVCEHHQWGDVLRGDCASAGDKDRHPHRAVGCQQRRRPVGRSVGRARGR
jgi:hypothetical protein